MSVLEGSLSTTADTQISLPLPVRFFYPYDRSHFGPNWRSNDATNLPNSLQHLCHHLHTSFGPPQPHQKFGGLEDVLYF